MQIILQDCDSVLGVAIVRMKKKNVYSFYFALICKDFIFDSQVWYCCGFASQRSNQRHEANLPKDASSAS